MTNLPPAPVDAVLPELLASLRAHPRAVLEAPPGAGKTTRVPLALLDAPWLAGRKLLVLEPRRIAARSAAGFMAAQLGEALGATVGYRIRFEARVSAATRIEIITEGILTRLLQDDPELPAVGAILFDEFHERHLHADLGAALALDVQASLRPDLRVLVMSATLDGARIARWLDAPRISSAGRSFPVAIVHPPARAGEVFPERGWPFHLRRAVEAALAETTGDVLAFLPGKREIARAAAALEALRTPDATLQVLPLHGELTLAGQQAALSPPPVGVRRIVLATNVAESSLTLPAVTAVVDLGHAREPRFDPNSGFTRLDAVRVSQASADQRAGRAGRTGPGTCWRLWPASLRLEAARRPEIAQVELSGLALELAAWGSDALPWLDAPPRGALAQARELLLALGALEDDGRISAIGRRMLALGAAPRLANAVLRAPPGQRHLACDLAALLEARNPLHGDAGRSDDFRLRLQALHAWRQAGGRPGQARATNAATLAAIDQAARAWYRRAGAANGATAAQVSPTAAGDLLVHAFPDRIARQDAGDPHRYTLANGRGARLAEDSGLYGEPWLVITDLRAQDRDSRVLAGVPFDPAVLETAFPARFRGERRVRWDPDKRAVEAVELQAFDAIVLDQRSVPVRFDEALPLLLAGVRALGLDALPWSEAARALRARIALLGRSCPELGLPDMSDAALLASLEDWLAPQLAGKRRLDALQPGELSGALAARLDPAARRALEQEAPLAVRVPSGLERRIDYAGEAPVLAVKLQELFGLAETPRIARGRIALTLHLLSPGGKPVQVTRDLRSFWERTYPEVKKQLKGRYPKHPWPDDPWSATPTHRAKPRR